MKTLFKLLLTGYALMLALVTLEVASRHLAEAVNKS